MSEQRLTNMAASVHQRLLNLRGVHKDEFNLILIRYSHERLLYRLVQAGFGDRFVLKGARLLALWGEQLYRPTRDLDLLGYGAGDAEHIASVFRAICAVEVQPDGLVFDPNSITTSTMREGEAYEGQRVGVTVHLGPARLTTQIDIGFGDAVVPSPVRVALPTLLDLPAPSVLVYPKEATVAEKLHAMVTLGMPNSRMKDFYDVWGISRNLPFDGRLLARSVAAAFHCRRTPLPTIPPLAFTADFYLAPEKAVQWQGFLKRIGAGSIGLTLADAILPLDRFLMPVLHALAANVEFTLTWEPGGPWSGAQEGSDRA